MRAICAGCGERIVSNVTGEHWHHLGVVATPHRAEPKGEPEHGCTRPDPLCPRCDPEEARVWLEARLAECDDQPPMPGLF